MITFHSFKKKQTNSFSSNFTQDNKVLWKTKDWLNRKNPSADPKPVLVCFYTLSGGSGTAEVGRAAKSCTQVKVVLLHSIEDGEATALLM